MSCFFPCLGILKVQNRRSKIQFDLRVNFTLQNSCPRKSNEEKKKKSQIFIVAAIYYRYFPVANCELCSHGYLVAGRKGIKEEEGILKKNINKARGCIMQQSPNVSLWTCGAGG